jgi:hypothetical protein
MQSRILPVKVIHLSLALAIFVTEVLIATVLSRVPFVRASLGDYLVVMLIYHFLQGCHTFSPRSLAVGVFLFACLVEGAQYLHLASVLGLRRGSVLAIILGSTFSWSDILMYLLGCLTSWTLDARLIRPTRAVAVR